MLEAIIVLFTGPGALLLEWATCDIKYNDETLSFFPFFFCTLEYLLETVLEQSNCTGEYTQRK